MKLDELMPQHDVAESYEITIAAPSDRVWKELFRVDLARLPAARRLMQLRSFGRRRTTPESRRTLESLASGGFLELARVPEEEIVFGVVGRFWRPVPSIERGWQPEGFAALAPEGSAKATWNFRLQPLNGSTLLSTETRVQCFGRGAKIKFRLYWTVVWFFSGWIRKEILRLVKSNAEH
jgi:hypothetical protein